MNLPSETDPFESVSESKEIAPNDRNDGRKLLMDQQKKLQHTQKQQQSTSKSNSSNPQPQENTTIIPEKQTSNERFDFDFDLIKEKLASKLTLKGRLKFDLTTKNIKESLDNINLPDHVKFPATFREGARNLYVQTRDNKKLPKSIRIYRERVTKKYAQEIRENEMEIEEEKNSYESYLTQRRDSVSSRLDNNINNNTDTELEYDAVADQFIEDRSVDVLFRPYAMTFILVVLLGIFFTGMTKNSNNLELPTSELVDNSNLSYNPEFLPLYRSIHLGVISCCTIFILIGILMLPSGPFTRPHPIVWRVTLSLSILYLMALIFTFFLSVEQVQKVLVYLFGQNILETASEAQLKEEYATNCNDISLSKLYSALDRYVAAHFLGWVCKSILLRSYGICWLISVTWEITEISFTHIVQNLTECWWDSWILDVLIFNGLGIYIGIKIANYLEMRSYKWESIKILDNQQELQVQVNQKNHREV